jgi:hypothetical protein
MTQPHVRDIEVAPRWTIVDDQLVASALREEPNIPRTVWIVHAQTGSRLGETTALGGGRVRLGLGRRIVSGRNGAWDDVGCQLGQIVVSPGGCIR